MVSLILSCDSIHKNVQSSLVHVSVQQVEAVSLLTGLGHSYLEARYFDFVLDKTLGFAHIYLFLLSSAGYVGL